MYLWTKARAVDSEEGSGGSTKLAEARRLWRLMRMVMIGSQARRPKGLAWLGDDGMGWDGRGGALAAI